MFLYSKQLTHVTMEAAQVQVNLLPLVNIVQTLRAVEKMNKMNASVF